MIEISHIHKAFGKKAVLTDCSLCADSGQITLLVGPNGSGKSTLLRMLAGLMKPDHGTIHFLAASSSDGDKVPLKPEVVSYLPQSPQFHPRLTSRHLLSFYGRLRGVSAERREAVAIRLGLQDHLETPTAQLSGGLRQRLGLAVLLLPDAPILLLDEPGLSLDPEWRTELYQILALEADQDKAVIVTTHLTAEWEGKAHRYLQFKNESDGTRIVPDERFTEIPPGQKPGDRLKKES